MSLQWTSSSLWFRLWMHSCYTQALAARCTSSRTDRAGRPSSRSVICRCAFAVLISLQQTFCVGLQTLIGDGILIYRCWFLWRTKSWLIAVFPMVIWLTNCAIHIRLMVLLHRVSQGLVTGALLQPWGEGFWVITISLNISCTGMYHFAHKLFPHLMSPFF